jgi:hypothetical protein
MIGKPPQPCVRPEGHAGRHRPAGYYEHESARYKADMDNMTPEQRAEIHRRKNRDRSDRRR